MTETTSPALAVALAYFRAWTGHDLDKAMTYIADDIVCDAPAGRLAGAAAYRNFMAALVMYDTETMPVRSAPGAECVTVADGKIIRSRFIFDRLPFEAARKAAD
jgi:ketosteroid isomerase-like protein